MPQLKVLITADAVGGVWQYATDLAHALVPLGIAPTLALLGPPPSASQRAAADGIALIETGAPLDWLSDSPEPVLAAGAAIARLAEDFDLVQLNTPALAAGAAFGVPVVAVTHGCLATWWEAANDAALPPDLAWQRELTAAALARADLVVSPTHAYAATVQRHYRLTRAPAVVHNGRRVLALSAPSPEPVAPVFTAGRLWDRVKNVGLLDRVAARIGVPFEAAGAASGPHGETIALDHIRPLGQLGDAALAARLAQRPVFVTAALFEPFGLAVLEAAQAGCPLVLSDIPGFRELWDGAALFVAPRDEEGYVGAIRSLLSDRTRRHALGEAAMARAGRYSPDAMAERMAGFYAALAPGRIATERAAA